MGVYTVVAAALVLGAGILVVITCSVTKAVVGLQQTQAGNAPTLVRHAILVLHFTICLGAFLVKLFLRGGAVWVRYTEASCVTHSRTRIIATPKSNRL